MTPHCLTTHFSHLPMMLLVLFALALQGCGDGVRILPPSDADPAGYYINTGTASVDDGAGGTISITDLQAMVDGNRIMMLSVAHELLYDGIITSITGNSFEADFTIYTGGKNPLSATVSGTITTGSSITGTLTGSGVGSGQFTLLYATTNDQAAAMTSAWRGSGGGFDEFGFTIDGAGKLVHDKTSDVLPFDTCKMNGTVTPVSGTRLYRVGVNLTDCDDFDVNGSYTGLTTTRDESVTNDRLVYAVSNGAYTLSGEFNID